METVFWYLAYRDANRVKFNFDLLLGNVEPKTFLPPSLSFSLGLVLFLFLRSFGWPVAFARKPSRPSSLRFVYKYR